MTAIDLDHLRSWIGKTETRTEVLGVTAAASLAATLDADPSGYRNGTPLPAGFHWMYFAPVVRLSEVGTDGHPARGGFLPPVPLPRRMWASSTCAFKGPLLLGSPATHTAEIVDVTSRAGKSGALIFVKVRFTVLDATGALAIDETRQTVYRDDPQPGAEAPPPTPAPGGEDWSKTIHPDPVLLFRYSALTFNCHRIHYDRPYATGVEGYPALVVHAPLVATMLLDELRKRTPGAAIEGLEFRAMRPLFEGTPFDLCGRHDAEAGTVHLWSRDADGAQCSDIRVRLRKAPA